MLSMPLQPSCNWPKNIKVLIDAVEALPMKFKWVIKG